MERGTTTKPHHPPPHILTLFPLSQHFGDRFNIHPQSIYELFKCEDLDKLAQIAEYCKKTLSLTWT